MNKEILQEKLKAEHISQRQAGGNMSLSYIESHHAIREANRAFDFDGWSYDITELKLVQDNTKENKWKKLMHYVSYIATVKVTVGDVVREDVGFGQGIDADLGKAHEGATKEAISDAQKRALRTFGDIFGLALYDKEQKNVDYDAPSSDTRGSNGHSNQEQNGSNSNQSVSSQTNTLTPAQVKEQVASHFNITVSDEAMKECFNVLKTEHNLNLITDFATSKEKILEIIEPFVKIPA